MKSLKLLLAGLAMSCSQAFAAPVTFTDTVTFTPPLYISVLTPAVIGFNLAEDGYNAATDTITTFSATFNLFDDNDQGFGSIKIEKARIGQIGSGDVTFTDLSGTESIIGSSFGELILNASGWAFFSVTSVPAAWLGPIPIIGDFYFGGATLTAQAERVPEPGSMLLIGAALSAAAFASRRRKL